MCYTIPYDMFDTIECTATRTGRDGDRYVTFLQPDETTIGTLYFCNRMRRRLDYPKKWPHNKFPDNFGEIKVFRQMWREQQRITHPIFHSQWRVWYLEPHERSMCFPHVRTRRYTTIVWVSLLIETRPGRSPKDCDPVYASTIEKTCPRPLQSTESHPILPIHPSSPPTCPYPHPASIVDEINLR